MLIPSVGDSLEGGGERRCSPLIGPNRCGIAIWSVLAVLGSDRPVRGGFELPVLSDPKLAGRVRVKHQQARSRAMLSGLACTCRIGPVSQRAGSPAAKLCCARDEPDRPSPPAPQELVTCTSVPLADGSPRLSTILDPLAPVPPRRTSHGGRWAPGRNPRSRAGMPRSYPWPSRAFRIGHPTRGHLCGPSS